MDKFRIIFTKLRVYTRKAQIMANFMGSPSGLRDGQLAGKTVFWVCLRGCFQKWLAFESVDWVKMTLISAGSIIKSLRAWKQQRGGRKANSPSLHELGPLSWTQVLLLLGLSDWSWDLSYWCQSLRPLGFSWFLDSNGRTRDCCWHGAVCDQKTSRFFSSMWKNPWQDTWV
jgi:hypothetical protein